MERSELIQRLVPLIPPPRAHQVRYHGILAPGASQRYRIVPDEAIEASTDGTMGGVGQFVAPTAGEPRGPAKAADLSNGPSGRGAGLENPPDGGESAGFKEEPSSPSDSRNRTRRMRWAALLQRVFEVDALRCPRCGSTLRLIAAIEDPMVARRILECLKLPARAPPLAPAAADAPDLGLGEDDWLFDQSPAHDEPEALISDS